MALTPASSRWNLHGKTALVTGATKGIGKAIVEELAQLGASVYACSRTEEDLRERLKTWNDAGLVVHGSVCDVSSLEACKQLMADVSKQFEGKLNILVNNAGTAKTMATVDVSPEELSFLMRTNFESGFHLSQLAHPLLKASGEGNIVFNSSIAGSLAVVPHAAVYSATKAALNQLTKNLACEWAKDGIRVNTVAPGFTHSDLLDGSITPEMTAFVQSRAPLGRIGEATEVAAAVTFLCLPCASYTTGIILTVDGGLTAN